MNIIFQPLKYFLLLLSVLIMTGALYQWRAAVVGDTSQLNTQLSLCSWLQPIGVVRAFG
jgi:hypothetical protein